MDEGSAASIRHSAEADGVQCLYFRCAAEDADTRRAAEAAGYRLVDLPVELTTPIAGATTATLPRAVQYGQKSQLVELQGLTKGAFMYSRFYSDPGFPEEGCDRLYAAWIARSLDSEKEAILVILGKEGNPVAFTTLVSSETALGRIGLLAVSAQYRRAGLGHDLVAGAKSLCAERGHTVLCVTTQRANEGAMALYEREGFRISREDVWYHLWLTPRSGDRL